MNDRQTNFRTAVASLRRNHSPVVVASARAATATSAILGYLLAVLLASPAAGDELLVFTREGCAPCRAAKAALAADSSIAAGYKVTIVDTKADPDLAKRYRIGSVPVFVIVRDGTEIRRKVGFDNARTLEAWLQNKRKIRRR